MRDDLAGLRVEQLREALSLLGLGGPADLPAGRISAGRALRTALAEPGFVRARLNDAPAGAREAFARLVREGSGSVEALLGRGWWGRGLLPPPLDWLQRRALVVVAESGLVLPTAAAKQGWLEQRPQTQRPQTERPHFGGSEDIQPRATTRQEQGTPTQPHLRLVTSDDVPASEGESSTGESGGAGESGGDDGASGQSAAPAHGRHPPPVTVESAGSVVVVEHPGELDRALGVPAAGLRVVAPTVAVSKLSRGALEAALRAGGVRLRGDEQVNVRPAAPALPGSTERAVTPWGIRSIFRRALDEDRQVHLLYYPSSRGGAATQRTVDPWSFADDLLLGWCHLRSGERTFALDRVGEATLLASPLEHRPS